MKILRLDLTAFGAFTDRSLDLSAGDEGLHIVFGANEAGKSTALRALECALFGVPNNTRDNFQHGNTQMRIGAMLRSRDGTTLQCVRRKGAKNTLLEADGCTPLDDSPLHAMLAGVDREMFRSMFGIDSERLVQGGRALISEHGALGQLLFAAGSGVGDLRSVQKGLESDAEALFKGGGKNPKINALISEFNELGKQIREAQKNSMQWPACREAYEQALVHQQTAAATLLEKSQQRERLERLRQALPLVVARRALKQQLAELGPVAILPRDFAEQRRACVTRLEVATSTASRADAALQEAHENIQRCDVDAALLQQVNAIEKLYKELGAHQKANVDCQRLIAQADQLRSEAANMLRDLRPELSIDDVDAIRFTASERLRISNLAAQHTAISAALRDSKNKQAESRDKLAAMETRLASMPKPHDMESLRQAIRVAEQHASLEAAATEQRDQAAALRRQADIDIARLGLFQGDLETLQRLPVPPVETVDSFASRQESLDNATAALRGRREQERTDLGKLTAKLEQLQLEQAPPSESQLRDARALREQGWGLIRRQLQGEAIDADAVAAFARAAGDHRDLLPAYEKSVEQADAIADRLRREAERVERQSQWLANAEQHRQRIATLDDDLQKLNDEAVALSTQWTHVWSAAGIEPRSPKEMRAWLHRHAQLLALAQNVSAREGELCRLDAQIAEQRNRLHLALTPAATTCEPASTLVMLLEAARRAVAENDETARIRQQLQADVARLQEERLTAARRLHDAEAAFAAWELDWRETAPRLGMDQRATPQDANQLLEQIKDLFDLLKSADEKAMRVREINNDAQRFAAGATELAAAIAPDLCGASAERVAADLHARLAEARTQADRLERLRKSAAQQKRELETAQTTILQARAELSTLCQEARCATPEELPAAEEKSARRVELERDLKSKEADLQTCCAGGSIESLEAELDSIDADMLGPQIEQLQVQITQASSDNHRWIDAIGSQRTRLEQFREQAGVGDTALVADRRQSLLAEINASVEQYAGLRLAQAILRRAVERYREKNQDPILTRASDLFRELTLGSFCGLRPELNDRGEQALFGVRDGSETLVDVESMSEGTADQLYLSLRLASLERYLDERPPMPFIVDDILIKFDNERAVATLRTLIELSRRTQVIFFTHHEHLLELAAEHLPRDAYFTHSLSDSSSPPPTAAKQAAKIAAAKPRKAAIPANAGAKELF